MLLCVLFLCNSLALPYLFALSALAYLPDATLGGLKLPGVPKSELIAVLFLDIASIAFLVPNPFIDEDGMPPSSSYI